MKRFEIYMLKKCPVSKKYCYTHRQAKKVARRLEAKGSRRLNVYRCQHCNECHVGHPPAYVVPEGASR